MTKRNKHGLSSRYATPVEKKIYRAWRDIRERCYNESHKEFFRYGGCGIKLQQSWEEDAGKFYTYVVSLQNFSVNKSLDRLDNSKGYEEGNLRWATDAEQVRNRGMQRNNSSGKNGVTWYYNKTGGTRAVAWWQVNGKSSSKSFSVKKFGLLPAFAMACEYRSNMIKQLNDQGAGYTLTHGLQLKGLA